MRGGYPRLIRPFAATAPRDVAGQPKEEVMVNHRLYRHAPTTRTFRRSRILAGAVLPHLALIRLSLVLTIVLLLSGSAGTVDAREATAQAETTLEIVAG